MEPVSISPESNRRAVDAFAADAYTTDRRPDKHPRRGLASVPNPLEPGRIAARGRCRGRILTVLLADR
jgi:hypothetical protein